MFRFGWFFIDVLYLFLWYATAQSVLHSTMPAEWLQHVVATGQFLYSPMRLKYEMKQLFDAYICKVTVFLWRTKCHFTFKDYVSIFLCSYDCFNICIQIDTGTQACDQGGFNPLQNFLPPLEKCVKDNLKLLDIEFKRFGPLIKLFTLLVSQVGTGLVVHGNKIAG